MSIDPPAPSARPSNPWLYVLAGGLAAGTLDIVYACVYWGMKRHVPAQRILQSVAAGLLGKASFDGRGKTAALGLALHFFIAVTMAVTYFAVARRWALLWQRPWLFLVGVPCALFARRAIRAGSAAA